MARPDDGLHLQNHRLGVSNSLCQWSANPAAFQTCDGQVLIQRKKQRGRKVATPRRRRLSQVDPRCPKIVFATTC